ncbi:hypothetical protein [Streptomyces sp. NPDC052107]|uniref:hypothetical protein n=1 Tax=Streptomyces sp. NPDC052107 TaxID=3155632 RepID=UPI0034467DCF
MEDDERDSMISAVDNAAIGAILPVVYRARINRIASLSGLFAAGATGGLLLCVLNGRPFAVMQSPGLGIPLLTQGVMLVVLIAAGTLWNRRRKVLFQFREMRTASQAGDDFPLLISLLLVAIPLVGLPWAATVVWPSYSHWATGWQLFLCVGPVLGMIAGRTLDAVWRLLERHWRPAWEEVTDQMVWQLHYLAWLLAVQRPSFMRPLILRVVRADLDRIARIIEGNPVPVRLARWHERALRRRIRTDHLRVAAALRDHSRAMASVRTLGDYDSITESIVRGALAAATGDWDALLFNTPEVNFVSRVTRVLRRLSSTLLLTTAALVIPMLPGVTPAADGVRIVLFSTAVLSLLPAADTTRAELRGALDRALFK